MACHRRVRSFFGGRGGCTLSLRGPHVVRSPATYFPAFFLHSCSPSSSSFSPVLTPGWVKARNGSYEINQAEEFCKKVSLTPKIKVSAKEHSPRFLLQSYQHAFRKVWYNYVWPPTGEKPPSPCPELSPNLIICSLLHL